MKKFLTFVIIVLATNVVLAGVIVSSITRADVDALASEDIIWNAQYFPGGGSMGADDQFSVGSGINGYTGRYGSTDWLDSPSLNPFTVAVDTENNLTAGVNSDVIPSGYEYPITKDYNEIWVFIEADSTWPDSGDILEISGLSIDGNSLPTQTVSGGTGFSGFKLRFDNEPNNIADMQLNGNIEQHFGVASDKNWVVKSIGVVPEPSSILLLSVAGVFAFILKKRIN